MNHATGDDFVLFLKELVMPDGQRRPYSMWLSGEYPRVMDGLCKALSLDMRVYDPAWIGMKLRKLLNYGEPNGSFMARTPGSDKAQTYPSTIAYLAQLMIHRYAMLGILTEQGYPVEHAGILAVPPAEQAHSARAEDAAREEVPRVRQQGADPQGRLRLLHRLRLYRRLRLTRLPPRVVVGEQLRDAPPDRLVGLVGQVGERHPHRHPRRVEAAAVQQHDAALLGQPDDEVDRLEARHQPVGEGAAVARARQRRDVDGRVVAGEQRTVAAARSPTPR